MAFAAILALICWHMRVLERAEVLTKVCAFGTATSASLAFARIANRSRSDARIELTHGPFGSLFSAPGSWLQEQRACGQRLSVVHGERCKDRRPDSHIGSRRTEGENTRC